MIKKCPLLNISDSSSKYVYDCLEKKCGFWVEPYTTEGLSAGGMCALVMIAGKNSSGHLVV